MMSQLVKPIYEPCGGSLAGQTMLVAVVTAVLGLIWVQQVSPLGVCVWVCWCVVLLLCPYSLQVLCLWELVAGEDVYTWCYVNEKDPMDLNMLFEV